MDGRMEGWLDRWLEGRMDEWMDGGMDDVPWLDSTFLCNWMRISFDQDLIHLVDVFIQSDLW